MGWTGEEKNKTDAQKLLYSIAYVPVVYALISSSASLLPSMTSLFLILVILSEGVTSSTPIENPLSPRGGEGRVCVEGEE